MPQTASDGWTDIDEDIDKLTDDDVPMSSYEVREMNSACLAS
jgi:hypothetical protein